MKKLLAILLTIMLIFSFAACGGNKDAESKPGNTQSGNTQVEFVKPENYASVVKVTINPELKLYLNANNNILAVEPVNDDATKLIKDLQLEGTEFKNAVKEIVTTANKQGFIKPDITVNFTLEESKDETVDTNVILNTAYEVTTGIAQTLSVKIEVKTEVKAETNTPDKPESKPEEKPESKPEPKPSYTSVKSKNGVWKFMYVGNRQLNNASINFYGAEIYAAAGIGDNIKDYDGVMLPEELEDCIDFEGETYRVAKGTGSVPLNAINETGNAIIVTDHNGKKLTLQRTSETTLKVTASEDTFSEFEGKVPVGTVITFEAN